jgi:hypothetical protein
MISQAQKGHRAQRPAGHRTICQALRVKGAEGFTGHRGSLGAEGFTGRRSRTGAADWGYVDRLRRSRTGAADMGCAVIRRPGHATEQDLAAPTEGISFWGYGGGGGDGF